MPEQSEPQISWWVEKCGGMFPTYYLYGSLEIDHPASPICITHVIDGITWERSWSKEFHLLQGVLQIQNAITEILEKLR